MDGVIPGRDSELGAQLRSEISRFRIRMLRIAPE